MRNYFKILLILVFALLTMSTRGQDAPTISKYDDESIRTFNIPELLKNFENALNIISYSGSEAMDIKTVSDNLMLDGESPRSFYNDKVIIESDLSYNSYLNNTKEDLAVKEYLLGFNALYPKTQKPTVSFHILKISALKKTNYFFYNVLYESAFNNKDNSGIQYKTLNRIAEIRLEYDTTWNVYIQAIRFVPKNFNIDNSRNNFIGFVEKYDQTTEYKMSQLELRKNQQNAERVKINQIIAEGDNLVLQGSFLLALEKYKVAWANDTYNDVVKEKIENCEQLLASQNRDKNKAEVLQQTIDGLKQQTLKLFSCYSFVACKHLRDSLTVYYNQTKDSLLNSIGNQLSVVMPFIEKASMFEKKNDFEGLLELSTEIVRSKKNNNIKLDDLLFAEALYRSALAFYLIDSSDYKNISEFGEEAMKVTGKAHVLCGELLVRAGLINQRNRLKALELATQLADRYPDNPALRALRGEVFYSLNDPKGAIREYKLAIDLKSSDSVVYIAKSRIENETKQYASSILTCDAGLKLFPCNNNLFYNKILSEEQLGLYYMCGNDFDSALSCGLNGDKKDTIVEHGKFYYEKGLFYFDNKNLDSAITYFDRSYKLSRNLSALFFRGYTNMKANKNSQALADLNNLITRDSAFKDAFYMRGLINATGGDHKSAISDFETQIKLTPSYWKSYAMCGASLQELGRFKEAAKMYVNASQIKYTDTIAAKAICAFYLANEYEQAINQSAIYINQIKTKYGPIYKYKGMSEYKITAFKAAREDLATALNTLFEDYETNLFMAKNAVALGDAEQSVKYAEKANRICNDCPEALVWWGICIIAHQQPLLMDSGIKKIKSAMAIDPKFKTASNLAWIAYGQLISRNDMYVFRTSLTIATNVDPTDPVVLFVKASSQAEYPDERASAMKTLDQACALGFFYEQLIKKDPLLRNCRDNLEYKSINKRYFND